MKKYKLFMLLIVPIFILFANVSFADSEPEITSKAAILIDNDSNKILYDKNSKEKMYPASTTKIMTAILALENGNLDDTVTVSASAVEAIPEGYSTAYLQVGEKLTVEQLLQLLLVHSANDAANVLAEYAGGTINSFVSMMNTKVHELNLTNTHFTNAFGMHDENHYTTAFDLSKIMQYCIKNDAFRKITGSASCSIPSSNMYGVRAYSNTNEMLNPDSKYYYQYLIAGKTGYTSQAKDCLVSVAYKNDLQFTCVVLGGDVTSSGLYARFAESKILYEYGYKNYSMQQIFTKDTVATQIEIENATKDTKNLDLLVSDDVSSLLSNDISITDLKTNITLKDNLSAPIEEGTVLGTIECTTDGTTYKSNIVASHSVQKSKLLTYILYAGGFFVVIIIIFEFGKLRKAKKSRYKKRY